MRTQTLIYSGDALRSARDRACPTVGTCHAVHPVVVRRASLTGEHAKRRFDHRSWTHRWKESRQDQPELTRQNVTTIDSILLLKRNKLQSDDSGLQVLHV